jgi:hypothetical protein
MNSLTLQANAGGCGGVAIAEPFVRLVDKLKLRRLSTIAATTALGGVV